MKPCPNPECRSDGFQYCYANQDRSGYKIKCICGASGSLGKTKERAFALWDLMLRSDCDKDPEPEALTCGHARSDLGWSQAGDDAFWECQECAEKRVPVETMQETDRSVVCLMDRIVHLEQLLETTPQWEVDQEPNDQQNP